MNNTKILNKQNRLSIFQHMKGGICCVCVSEGLDVWGRGQSIFNPISHIPLGIGWDGMVPDSERASKC